MALLKHIALLLLLRFISSSSEEEPSSCDVFLAPSKIHGGGYGVFAARDFEVWEIVEFSPLFLPFEKRAPILMNTVVNDYHYGYTRGEELLGVVAFGMIMFYNHAPEPNLQWTANIGRGEPSEKDPDSAGSALFVAKRNISKGEELFSTYGPEDGGVAWFEARGIPLASPDSIAQSNIPLEELDEYRRTYCSKSFAGIGSDTYNNRILYKGVKSAFKFQTERLPSKDAPTAIAKVSIKAGDRIEIAPALVLSRDFVEGTALAPLGYNWEDLDEEHHAALKELREAGKLKVQHQSPATEWHRLDGFKNFGDVVVFPAAGNIGVIERVGQHDPNCKVEIKSSGPDSEGAGLVLEVIAIKDIGAGDTLRLNIEPTGSGEEKLALIEILEITGQPLSDSLKAFKAAVDKGGHEL